jgi:hypothetical protein
MKLYHITPSKNSHSIAIEGLIPARRNGLTSSGSMEIDPWRKDVVWLTDDVDYILRNQAGSHWIKYEQPIVFEIDCSSLNIVHREGFFDDHEYMHYGIIPSELIIEQKPVDICTEM